MDTQKIEKVVLEGNSLDVVRLAHLNKILIILLEDCLELAFKELFKEEWIPVSGHYYVPRFERLIKKSGSYGTSGYDSKLLGMTTSEMSEKEVKYLFYTHKDICPIISNINSSSSYNFFVSNGYRYCHFIQHTSGSYNLTCGVHDSRRDSYCLKISSAKCTKYQFRNAVLAGDFNLTGKSDFVKTIKTFSDAGIVSKEQIAALGSELLNTLAVKLGVDKIACEQAAQDIYGGKVGLDNKLLSEFKDYILSCDEMRVELEKYDAKCLEDVNLGHWELWSDDENIPKDAAVVKLSEPLIARNPVADIRRDGIIGIDFGTKSTIVSCKDGGRTKLLRVGIGQLRKKVKAEHYENPTVMEFVDLDKFISDYTLENGRPHTSINDLTVSHKAANSMKDCEKSDLFYSFFYDIKQWCGDSNRYKQIKIIDQNKKERILPPYLDIQDGEFDPVEIYAYLLGLFINNMRSGIYMNYFLSFPVTYEKAVKDKLLNSFRRGLEKSLPDAVLNDEEVMKSFSVKQGISEPAAYAICALNSLGFDPEEDENIFYGIFDFGGGTTDFDFGMYRAANDSREEERYDNVIEQFSSEGDKYLGGENLLELVAFEIFKANAKKLIDESGKEPEFSFFKPTECDDFPGSEMLISNSQEAKRNTKQLMEALRPVWEGVIDYQPKQGTAKEEVKEVKVAIDETEEDKPYVHESGYVLASRPEMFQSSKIKVALFDKNGEKHENFSLDIINNDENINVDIFGILENRIQRGVNNFFEALKLSFENRKDDKIFKQHDVHIFLAGNSAKSPILHKCFNETMVKYSKELLHDETGFVSEGADEENFFHLYYPLGTPQADAFKAAKHLDDDLNDIMRPTGKTGVAYGLIEGRDGGTIKVIPAKSQNEEIRFRYFVGRARRKKFKVYLDRNTEYGKWVRFIDASIAEFEVYYSDLPESANGSYSIENVRRKYCKIEQTDPDADIYIRAVKPSVLEYAVAKSDDEIEKGNFIGAKYTLELK